MRGNRALAVGVVGRTPHTVKRRKKKKKKDFNLLETFYAAFSSHFSLRLIVAASH